MRVAGSLDRPNSFIFHAVSDVVQRRFRHPIKCAEKYDRNEEGHERGPENRGNGSKEVYIKYTEALEHFVYGAHSSPNPITADFVIVNRHSYIHASITDAADQATNVQKPDLLTERTC